MTLVARRRAALLVPWLALVAVTAFAIVQMRARHQAERAETAAAVDTPAPAEGTPAPARTDVATAAHATEAALDVALADLAAARTEAARLAREGSQAASRAEAAEARLAAQVARVAALEQELASVRAAAADEQPVEVAPPQAAPDEELLSWVERAASTDLRLRQAALEQAVAATPEQVARLGLLRETGADPVALARLAGALPAGDATDALVIDLLVDERADFGTASRVVGALGSGPLLRPAVLEVVLGLVSPGTLKVALGVLAGFEAELGDEARRTELAAALAPRFGSGDVSQLHAGARAAGLLRLPGLAPRLVALLEEKQGAVRVAAAHALSLVPDLDAVRAQAVKALPSLLLDDSLSVRTAGALLAETLVAAPVDYDPAAGEGARREALDAILDRLQ